MRSDASAGSTTKGLSNLHVSDTDSCGYCGLEFVNDPEPDWAQRVEHLTQVHKFNECTQNKKFFRADHFRQHLKHSHAGTSGKWTNMLEAACMRDEQPPVPIARDAVVTLAAMGPEAGMVVTDSSGTLPVLSPIKPVPLQPQLSQIPQLPQLPQLSQIPQQPLPTRIPLPASQPPSPPQQQQPQQEQEQPQKLQPLAPMQARVEITPEPDPGDQLREQRQQQRQQNQQQQQQQDATAVAVH